jgi:uncharacterized repeat protein (TIGR01451 family)
VLNGDTLHYVVYVTNPTKRARKFDVEDKIPANSEYINNTANLGGKYDASGKKIVWTGVEIAAGKTAEFKFNVKAIASDKTKWTEIHNIADAWMQKSSGARNNKTKQTTNEVVNYIWPPKGDSATKSVTDIKGVDIDTEYVEQNDNLYYHITVKNGTPKAREFTITDKVPANTSFVSVADGGTHTSGTVKWVKTIPGKGSVTVNFVVKATKDNSDIINFAHVKVDHVEVDTNEVTNKTAIIVINKKIDNYYENFGQPSFIYKITGSDGSVAYRMIEITNKSNGTTTFAVPRYTADGTTYVVEELRNARYEFKSLSTSTAATAKINGQKANIAFAENNRKAEVSYVNEIIDWKPSSHAASATNKVGKR